MKFYWIIISLNDCAFTIVLLCSLVCKPCIILAVPRYFCRIFHIIFKIPLGSDDVHTIVEKKFPSFPFEMLPLACQVTIHD